MISYENLDKIGEIALYYGFFPKQSPAITKADLDQAKSLIDSDTIDNEEDGKVRLPLHVEEKQHYCACTRNKICRICPSQLCSTSRNHSADRSKSLRTHDIATWKSSAHLAPSPKRLLYNLPASFWPKKTCEHKSRDKFDR